jgi:hypothetical protein
LGAAVLLLVPLPLRAANEAKPNRLTPQEIADGWLLLFDGETTFGWESDGPVKVVDGTLVIGGERQAITRPTAQFGDFEMRFECRKEGSGEPEIGVGYSGESATTKLPDNSAGKWVEGTGRVQLQPMKFNISVEADQTGNGTVIHSSGNGSSPAGFFVRVPPGGRLSLRNVKLKPLGLKPIFNGKDLAGWKEFPGRKSKFTITPEGWLNIKDGPGDLQTEGQWADFVLQLDCISNGKHLNSGVFFRCRPGEYQQGYEAQIRNQFTPEATQEYTLDVYDPKTGELADKKKAKYTAVDYGTGAIYRRQPARREVAKDGEWFTLTLVAHGRHLAVWVNGVQVTDWIDHRPLRDNARNGCRLEKGPISLQGHDPTTDLSFRNFRVAELPGAKKE